jgi:primosomal protein N' (replication factor Y)
MLAKGHDLPRLTLVAVVGVDEGLFSADFRAGERLAQFWCRSAGRAGRAELPARCCCKTHHPEHPLLGTCWRRLSGGGGADPGRTRGGRLSRRSRTWRCCAPKRCWKPTCKPSCAKRARFSRRWRRCMPPHRWPRQWRAVPARRRGQLLLTGEQRPPLQSALGQWIPRLYALKSARKVRWSIDVDPMDLY